MPKQRQLIPALVCAFAVLGCSDKVVGTYDGEISYGDAGPTNVSTSKATLTIKPNHEFIEEEPPFTCEGTWTSDGKKLHLKETKAYRSGKVVPMTSITAPYQLDIQDNQLILLETSTNYVFKKR